MLRFIVAIASMFSAVIAHCGDLPMRAGGLGELKKIASIPGRVDVTEFQVLNLNKDIELLGIFDKVGSGIVVTTAHIYACEPNKCFLFFLFRSRERMIGFDFKRNSGEIILLAGKSKVLARGYFPELAMASRIKELSN
jgi:hypothetical protein